MLEAEIEPDIPVFCLSKITPCNDLYPHNFITAGCIVLGHSVFVVSRAEALPQRDFGYAPPRMRRMEGPLTQISYTFHGN